MFETTRRAAASELGSSSLGALSVRCSEGLGALDGAVVLELESFWLTPTPESIRREGKHNVAARPTSADAYLGPRMCSHQG